MPSPLDRALFCQITIKFIEALSRATNFIIIFSKVNSMMQFLIDRIYVFMLIWYSLTVLTYRFSLSEECLELKLVVMVEPTEGD